MVEDPSPPLKRYDPGHPDAGPDGYVAYPDINPLTEMVDLMGATRAYGLNGSAVQAEKGMIASALEIAKILDAPRFGSAAGSGRERLKSQIEASQGDDVDRNACNDRWNAGCAGSCRLWRSRRTQLQAGNRSRRTAPFADLLTDAVGQVNQLEDQAQPPWPG